MTKQKLVKFFLFYSEKCIHILYTRKTVEIHLTSKLSVNLLIEFALKLTGCLQAVVSSAEDVADPGLVFRR